MLIRGLGETRFINNYDEPTGAGRFFGRSPDRSGARSFTRPPPSTSWLRPPKVLRMHRREFTKLSALTLASSFVPSFAQKAALGKPVGYAAIGLGRICDIFMRACALTQSSKITAL